MLGRAGDAVQGGAAAQRVHQGVVAQRLAGVQEDLAAGQVELGDPGLAVGHLTAPQHLGQLGPLGGPAGRGLVLADPVQEPALRGDQGDPVLLADPGGRRQARVAGADHDDVLLLTGHLVLLRSVFVAYGRWTAQPLRM
ncbi:hypothetical protein GCM10009664_24190 [Kitasatospora gansuensis]